MKLLYFYFGQYKCKHFVFVDLFACLFIFCSGLFTNRVTSQSAGKVGIWKTFFGFLLGIPQE